MKRKTIARSCMIATAILGLATTSALAAPYSLIKLISVPPDAANVQPGGGFTAYDTSFFDPVTRNDYVADRSNASVDIFSGTSLSFLGRAIGFAGQTAITSTSGPNGVLTVTAGGVTTLYTGDGNSTLKVFNVTNPAAPSLLQSISTGGSFRVDAMAYSPLTHQVLAANNAETPAYGSLFSTTNGGAPVALTNSNITIPGADPNGGLEQPVWDASTGTFFIAVPAFNVSGSPGGVAEIRTNGTVGRIYDFATMGISNCTSTGLALGASGDLLVGCGSNATQTILLNPAGSGSIVKTFTQISGSDEIWFDPGTDDFFVMGKNITGDPVFDVISDSTDALLQAVLLPTSANPHSISVDPFSGDVFVPLSGSTPGVADTTCPLGCIAVFAQVAQVPEPATLALLGLGLAGLGFSRRKKA